MLQRWAPHTVRGLYFHLWPILITQTHNLGSVQSQEIIVPTSNFPLLPARLPISRAGFKCWWGRKLLVGTRETEVEANYINNVSARSRAPWYFIIAFDYWTRPPFIHGCCEPHYQTISERCYLLYLKTPSSSDEWLKTSGRSRNHQRCQRFFFFGRRWKKKPFVNTGQQLYLQWNEGAAGRKSCWMKSYRWRAQTSISSCGLLSPHEHEHELQLLTTDFLINIMSVCLAACQTDVHLLYIWPCSCSQSAGCNPPKKSGICSINPLSVTTVTTGVAKPGVKALS